MNLQTVWNKDFEYCSLDRKTKQIRLLFLPQRKHSQSLLSRDAATWLLVHGMFHGQSSLYECSMICGSLATLPPYRALSYTWGEEAPANLILIDGQPLWLPYNLSSAIHHLTQSEDIWLWVDAVCINQSDSIEKSWQVEQMRLVYECAESVHVWLGEANLEDVIGMRKLATLEHLVEQASVEAGHTQNLSRSRALRTLDQIQMLWFLAPEELAQYSARKARDMATESFFPLNAVKALLEKPWWGRIWIFQEFACAKQVFFHCGYEKMPGEALANFLHEWDAIPTGTMPMLLDQRPWALFEARHTWRSGHPLMLKDLLQITSKCQSQCKYAQDSMYALRGIASDGKTLLTPPDYANATAQTVLVDATIAMIEENDLWFLSFCNNTVQSSLGLPSWVPDWSQQAGEIPILQAGGACITGRPSPFYASHGAYPIVSVISQSPPHLAIMGIEVDVVSHIGIRRPNVSQNHLQPDMRALILRWLHDEFRVLVNTGTKRPGYADAVWRVPVLDQMRNRATNKWGRLPASMHTVYDFLLAKAKQDQVLAGELNEVQQDYFSSMMNVTGSRRPFRTATGYLGLGPAQMETGDLLVVLFGCDVPFLLRPPVVNGRKVEGRWTLVGEAFVHGLMFGELMKEPSVLAREKVFELV